MNIIRALENIVETNSWSKKERNKTLSMHNYVMNNYPGYSVSVSRTTGVL